MFNIYMYCQSFSNSKYLCSEQIYRLFGAHNAFFSDWCMYFKFHHNAGNAKKGRLKISLQSNLNMKEKYMYFLNLNLNSNASCKVRLNRVKGDARMQGALYFNGISSNLGMYKLKWNFFALRRLLVKMQHWGWDCVTKMQCIIELR